MNIILTRYHQDNDETLGMLHSNCNLMGYTLEDEHREVKVKGKTRVPAGKYELVIQHFVTPMTEKYRARYKWFDKHIMLLNVPNFTNVYMHIGNEGSDSSGCILIADQPSALSEDNRILYSARRFQIFYNEVYNRLIRNERTFLIIRNEKDTFKE